MASPDLNKKQILNNLAEPVEILILDSTTSTNDVAKEKIHKIKDSLLLIATNKQTAGRGRLGRNFYSEISHGLYFSLAFYPEDLGIEEIPQYTVLAAAALVETLEQMTGKDLAIKWVNDIFYNGRKISGILSEMVTTNQMGVVVGIGINFSGDFNETSEDTQQVAGTLFGTKTPETFNQNEFLQKFIERFTYYHQHFHDKPFLSIYEEHLLGVGKEVYYFNKKERHEGTILGINNQGHLKVEKKDGQVEILYSHEVHFNSRQFLR